MKRVVDALGEENAGQLMRAPRVHKLGGGSDLVPALAVVVHHPEVESSSYQWAGGDEVITSAVIDRFGLFVMTQA